MGQGLRGHKPRVQRSQPLNPREADPWIGSAASFAKVLWQLSEVEVGKPSRQVLCLFLHALATWDCCSFEPTSIYRLSGWTGEIFDPVTNRNRRSALVSKISTQWLNSLHELLCFKLMPMEWRPCFPTEVAKDQGLFAVQQRIFTETWHFWLHMAKSEVWGWSQLHRHPCHDQWGRWRNSFLQDAEGREWRATNVKEL